MDMEAAAELFGCKKSDGIVGPKLSHRRSGLIWTENSGYKSFFQFGPSLAWQPASSMYLTLLGT